MKKFNFRNIFLLSVLSFCFHSVSYANDKEKCSCSEQILDLKGKILALEERIFLLENKKQTNYQNNNLNNENINMNNQNSVPWICVWKGFSQGGDGYSAVAESRAVASMKAHEKCKKHDQDNGFFCKEDKGSQ